MRLQTARVMKYLTPIYYSPVEQKMHIEIDGMLRYAIKCNKCTNALPLLNCFYLSRSLSLSFFSYLFTFQLTHSLADELFVGFMLAKYVSISISLNATSLQFITHMVEFEKCSWLRVV
jgi:hypothetical protein